MTTATSAPSKKVLSYVIEYFRGLADKQHKSLKRQYGIVEFMYKNLEEYSREQEGVDRIITKSEIVYVMKWLREKGFAQRLQVGKHKNPSVWDVRNLLAEPPIEGEPDIDEDESDDYAKNVTKENQIVFTKIASKVAPPADFKIDLVDEIKEPETKVEYKVQKKDNSIVLSQINESINDMIGYLQTLPTEMMSELNSFTKDLEYVDHNIVLQLTKEKEDLKEQVSQLKTELERASATPDYSEHYIYRQRNLILDEVQRMLHAPAWSVRQNKDHYQNSIVEKLDNIMDHLNIKAE